MAGQQRTVLISGATKGLGRETARQLAQHGLFVYLGARDLTTGQQAAQEITRDGGHARAVALDVTAADSIAAAVADIESTGRGLDILINNAGRIVEAPATQTTAQIMHAVFATNVFGVVELTRACLPLLARSSSPRIVNVSSTTASLSLTAAGHDFGGNAPARMAYSSSKAALNMITIQLSGALRADPELAHIKVNSVTPGYVATDMNAHQGTKTVTDGARVIIDLAVIGPDGPTGGFFNDQGPVNW
jgi:NAD(P)-dependent dehydrogenase (short-subunit alcohol dehydrogenase family)